MKKNQGWVINKFKTSNGDAKDSHQRCLHLNKIIRKMKSKIFDKPSLIICTGSTNMTGKLVFLQEMGEGNLLDLIFFRDFVVG